MGYADERNEWVCRWDGMKLSEVVGYLDESVYWVPVPYRDERDCGSTQPNTYIGLNGSVVVAFVSSLPSGVPLRRRGSLCRCQM